MRDGWIKNERLDTEAYDFADISRADSYVSVYSGRIDCFFKVARGYAELRGIMETLEAAMIEAERLIDLPIEVFNAMAIANLTADITSLEQKILRIAPNSEILRGYHAWYEAGKDAVKRMIAEVLE